jgi:hypothetical protein
MHLKVASNKAADNIVHKSLQMLADLQSGIKGCIEHSRDLKGYRLAVSCVFIQVCPWVLLQLTFQCVFWIYQVPGCHMGNQSCYYIRTWTHYPVVIRQTLLLLGHHFNVCNYMYLGFVSLRKGHPQLCCV